MPASNVFQLAFALQSAKGAAAATPQYLIDVTDADLKPTADIQEREETGLGRDVGDNYIKVLSAEGSASIICRPKTTALLLYGVLGAKAAAALGTVWTSGATYTQGQIILPTDTTATPYIFEVTTAGTSGTTEPTWGTTPGATTPGAGGGTAVYTNRGALKTTHTLTPAADQPWMTVWRSLAGSIHEKFTDCKITQMQFEWEAGGDLTASMDIYGLAFERLSSFPAGGTYEQGQPFRVPGMEYSLESSVNDAITGGSLTIDAAQEPLQTVKIYNSYLEPSKREITASYDEIYQNVSRYAKTIYGSATGLAPSETIYEGAFQATFGQYAYGPGLRFVIPRFQFSEVEATPDSGGDPLVTPVSGKAARPNSGSILTATVVNDVASYPNAA